MKLLRELCIEDNKEQLDFVRQVKADRIELCSNLKYGGLTPKKKWVDYATNTLKLNTVMMIRVRKHDFYDTEKDIKKQIKLIQKFNSYPVSGFVFGILNKDNTINIEAMKKMMSCVAKDKYVVFHMAFDLIKDWRQAIDQLVGLNVKRILTKGGSGCALDNLEKLNKIRKYAKNRIEILAGGSITTQNYLEINKKTKIDQLHGRKIY